MKKLKLTKVIVSTLIAASILALNPIGANAEWKNDSNGWWNTEGNSWSIGWRQIDGNWYYFDSDGYMAINKIIDGYYVNSSGAWSLTQESQPSSEGIDIMDAAEAHPDSTSFDAETQKNVSENN